MFYKCPNCGRIYGYGEDGWYTCLNCRYPLKKVEDVKNVKHPELNEHNVIGTIQDPTEPTVECPYCHSTNTSKITNTSKAVHTALFGIFSMGRNSKNFHCNKCGADF